MTAFTLDFLNLVSLRDNSPTFGSVKLKKSFFLNIHLFLENKDKSEKFLF